MTQDGVGGRGAMQVVNLAVLLEKVFLRWAADNNTPGLVGLVAGLHCWQRRVRQVIVKTTGLRVGQVIAKTTGLRIGKVVAEGRRGVCH